MRTAIPDEIRTAVEALLHPYGGLEALQKDPPESSTEKRYLRIGEAEAYTGLSRWTIWRKVREGSLRKVSLGGGRSAAVRYDRGDLDRFMQKHKRTGCARG